MKDEEPRRCRRSRAWNRVHWRGHVAAQASSGQTAVAYCQAHGLHPKSFYRWKRVFRESGELEALLREGAEEATPSSGSPAPLFAEVRVADGAATAASGVEVALGSGVVVRVSRGFDGETLQRVVSALEDGRC